MNFGPKDLERAISGKNESEQASTDARVALVTGAASGVGRAVAERYVRKGIRVIGCDRHPQEPITGVTPVVLDVRDPDQLSRAVDIARDQFGRLDIVAAIAGVLRTSSVMTMSDADRDLVFGVNVFGVWNTVRATIPLLAESPGPRRILMCGSVATAVAAPEQAAYVASKHALVGMAKSLALELAPSGITVNVISPASVETDMFSGVDDRTREHFARTTPVGRLAQADEIASFFDVLASSETGYMTGSNIMVDGGCSIVNPHSLPMLDLS